MSKKIAKIIAKCNSVTVTGALGFIREEMATHAATMQSIRNNGVRLMTPEGKWTRTVVESIAAQRAALDEARMNWAVGRLTGVERRWNGSLSTAESLRFNPRSGCPIGIPKLYTK